MADAIIVAKTIAEVLESLGVVYWIGGSMASSIYGTPRSTKDVDLVADLKEEHVSDLVAALEEDFYIDAESVRRSIRSRRSFNVIHLDTMYKADIFILGTDRWSQEEKSRRRLEPLGPEPNAASVYFCSAEDILLQKLRWFQKSGGVSERQWDDILGVLKVQGEALDFDYLRTWADELVLNDLLAEAFDDAGLDPA